MPSVTESLTADTRRLLTSLCCGVALLAPLGWTLAATSDLGVAVGVVAAALTTLTFALLLRNLLPDGLVIAVLTAAYLVPLVLGALLVVGPRSSGEVSALVLGLPAVALVAVLTVRMTTDLGLGLVRDEVVPTLVIGGISLAICLGALAPFVHGRVAEARAQALIAAGFEGSGVLPLMPDLDGFSATEDPTVELASDGYVVELVEDGRDPVGGPSIHIEVGPLLDEEDKALERAGCDGGGRTCTRGDDELLVIEAPGEDTRVIATVGRTRLEAYLYDDEGELPSPSEVGRALREAELVDWDDVVRLGPESH